MQQQVVSKPIESTTKYDVDIDDMLSGVRELVPRLKQIAQQTEQDRRISEDTIARIREIGLFRLMQPQTFGGLEGRTSDFVRLMFELGRGCGSTAWSVSIPMIHNWLIGLYPLKAQEEVWRDKGALLAASYAPTGKCEAVEGGYAITGRWGFASNCDNSTWFVVCAALPSDGKAGPPNFGWFLIPKSEAEIEDTWFSMGMSGTGSKTIVVSEPTIVPEHRVLTVAEINSGAAPGSTVHSHAMYRLAFSTVAPFTLAAVPVGIAMGALEDFIALAREKVVAQPGGAPHPMAELPSVQLAIAEASAIIDSVSLMLLHDTESLDDMLAEGELPTMSQRVRYRRDHSWAANQAAKAVDCLFEAMGASGGDLASPVQRAWRDTNLAARHISLTWQTTGALYGQDQVGADLKGTY